jgi:hypothetical protein
MSGKIKTIFIDKNLSFLIFMAIVFLPIRINNDLKLLYNFYYFFLGIICLIYVCLVSKDKLIQLISISLLFLGMQYYYMYDSGVGFFLLCNFSIAFVFVKTINRDIYKNIEYSLFISFICYALIFFYLEIAFLYKIGMNSIPIIGFALGVIITFRDRLNKTGSNISIYFCVFFISLISTSRIGLVVSSLFLVYFLKNYQKKYIFLIFSLILPIGLFFDGYINITSLNRLLTTVDIKETTRFYLWAEFFKNSQIGIFSSNNYGLYFSALGGNMHNDFLHLISKFGLVGILMNVFLLIIFIKTIYIDPWLSYLMVLIFITAFFNQVFIFSPEGLVLSSIIILNLKNRNNSYIERSRRM